MLWLAIALFAVVVVTSMTAYRNRRLWFCEGFKRHDLTANLSGPAQDGIRVCRRCGLKVRS